MPRVILVINSSPDTVNLLTVMLEQFGFVVVSTYTFDIRALRVDLTALIAQHRPAVVVYDIAPPYDRNWQFYLHLRQTTLDGLPLVLTSTNAALTTQLVSPDRQIYEVQESVDSLREILAAVREALRNG